MIFIVASLTVKLKDLESSNQSLMKQIKQFKQVQNSRAKMLANMNKDNDFDQKIQNCVDEIKQSKEKIKELQNNILSPEADESGKASYFIT